MADEKGTGKHPHKSTEERWHHTESNERSGSQERSESREHSGEDSSHRQSGSGTSEGGPTSSSRDLKEREYRDEEGNVHHHTHTAEAMKDRKAS